MIISSKLRFSLISTMLVLPATVFGAGFAIQEHGITGLGNSYSAGAAAEDASTVYFNPAGMSYLEGSVITGGIHFILPDAEFTNNGTTTLNVPTSGGNSTSDENAIVPNLFYVTQLSDQWKFGIGISAPFGLTTEYEDGWVGRYIATHSSLSTVNINPSVAFAPDTNWSFGFGLNIAKVEAELSNAVDFGLVYLSQFQSGGIPINEQTAAIAQQVQANIGQSTFDGYNVLEGDDLAYGWNFGIMYNFDENTRAGFHYRSGLDSTIKGDVDFTIGQLEPFFSQAFADQNASVKLELPEIISFSFFHQTDGKWSFMADVSHTGWNSFQTLSIEFENPSPPTNIIREEWNNSTRFSVGANFAATDQLTLRFGASLDESPVPNDALRSPRIPDEDRQWLSAGLSYKVSEKWQLDASYLHVSVDDPTIDNDTHAVGQHLRGTIDASVNILSMGFSYRY